MSWKTLISTLLVAASAAAGAAPPDPANLCAVVGFEEAKPGQSFYWAIAAHALNQTYPSALTTPACQDAIAAGKKAAIKTMAASPTLNPEETRILLLATSFVDQVMGNMHANLRGF